jgi:hypothetical protein
MSNAWRRPAAALANEQQRVAYARAVLALPVENARAVAALRAAGLLDDRDAPTEVFARLLAEHPAETKQGVDRWLRDGRIDHYPAKPAQRLELLSWVAERAISAQEVLDEKALGERLAAFTGDVATLRRYLVDAGLLQRAADGSSYSR